MSSSDQLLRDQQHPTGGGPVRIHRTHPTSMVRALCALAALTVVAMFAAQSAQAGVIAYGEPTYTKTNGNNPYVFRWQAQPGFHESQDDFRYFLCEDTYQNGVKAGGHDVTQGPGSTDCSGLVWGTSPYNKANPPQGDYSWKPFASNTVLADGTRYAICT